MVDAKKFETLSILSQQFNEQCDSLNDTFTEWNQRLAALNLGVEVWLDDYPLSESVDYYEPYPNPDYEGQRKCCDVATLGYDKVEGSWQLAVKYSYYSYEIGVNGHEETVAKQPTEVIRLLSASREERLTAARQLDALFEAIEKKLTQGLKTVASAQKLAETETIK